MSIPPGPYYYVDDQPGAEPVACEIFEAEGALWARFPRSAEDDGAEILLEDLPGRFLHELQVGADPIGTGGLAGSRTQTLH